MMGAFLFASVAAIGCGEDKKDKDKTPAKDTPAKDKDTKDKDKKDAK